MNEKRNWKESIIEKWKLIYIIISLWVILATIFGFFDLQISISLTNLNNIPGNLGIFFYNFGKFGADYGEGPAWGLIFVALGILIGSYINDTKKQKVPIYFIANIFLVIFIIGIIINSEDLIWYGGFISFSALIFLIISLHSNLKNYRNFALIIVLLAIINPLLFVNITKFLCGRVRFNDLAPGYIGYTPWFLPPGPDPNNLSFPSGHAAMGWMLLPLLILLKDKKNMLKILGIILVFGWGIFVSISRIIIGAHYASDVLFSSNVAFITTIFLYKKLFFK